MKKISISKQSSSPSSSLEQHARSSRIRRLVRDTVLRRMYLEAGLETSGKILLCCFLDDVLDGKVGRPGVVSVQKSCSQPYCIGNGHHVPPILSEYTLVIYSYQRSEMKLRIAKANVLRKSRGRILAMSSQ